MSEIWKDIYFVQNGEIFDYRGLYTVSNCGRVKSFKFGKVKILKPGEDKGGYKFVVLCNNGKQKTFYIHRLVAHMFLTGYFEGADVDHINTDRTDNRSCNLRWCSRKENCNNELSKKHYSEASKEAWKNKSEEELAEFKRKLSEANKGENNPMYGKNHSNGMYGKNHSEEARTKMSETWKNRTDEELAEIGRKISDANKGEKNGRAVLVDRFTLNEQYLDTKYPFEYVEELGFSATGISNCCTGRTKSHKGFIFKYHKE